MARLQGMRRMAAFALCAALSSVLYLFLIACASSGGTAEQGDSPAAASSGQPEQESLGNLVSFEAGTLAGPLFTQDDLAPYDATLIYFWQTTCGPCLNEMDELNALHASLPSNVNMISVCFDGYADPDTAALFEGTTLINGSDDFLDVAMRVQYTPTTIVVDSQGMAMGEPIIGAPVDPIATFTALINDALAAQGKPTI